MIALTASEASNGVSSTERTHVQVHGESAFPHGRVPDGDDGDRVGPVHGRTGRRRQGGRPAHHDRAAARLVRLRRRHRRLQGEVSGNHDQRTQPGRRLGRRDRGDQGQQGQQGPAGARRHRRRPVLRPVRQGRRPDPALQGLDLGLDPGQRQGCRRLLVRRLLRRALLPGEQGPRPERAGRLGRPAEGRIQELGRSRRRSARFQPGDPGRLCRWPVEGRGGRRSRRHRRPRVLQGAQRQGQFRAGHRQGGDARAGPDADPRSPGTTTRSPAATR